MTKEFLTDEGKRYARYIYLAHVSIASIPLIGKWLSKWQVGFTAATIYSIIMKEGAKEHATRRKAKMSGMRNGISVNRGEASGEMREMRIRSQGISNDGTLAESSRETSEIRNQGKEIQQ